MWNLSDSQVALVVACFTLLAGLAAWFGRGIAFMLQRKVTDAKAKEDVAYIREVVDLSERLTANGMTIDDARRLGALLRAPAANHGEAAKEAMSALLEPEAFQSNMAMKMRAGAAYEVAEAKLKQVILDLELLLSEGEEEALNAAQEAWLEYRTRLEDRALRQFHGGTHATLAMAITGLSETERRTEELAAEVKERSTLYG
jgi:uncharacterized protein YecT (DUF1311 family)